MGAIKIDISNYITYLCLPALLRDILMSGGLWRLSKSVIHSLGTLSFPTR